jgi:hypothetical protein
LGDQSHSIHHFVVPLIRYSTDIDCPDQLYLFEEGLELWQNTLHNATKMTPELMVLFTNIVKIIEAEDFENITVVLRITDSYILLGKDVFLNVRQYSPSCNNLGQCKTTKYCI